MITIIILLFQAGERQLLAFTKKGTSIHPVSCQNLIVLFAILCGNAEICEAHALYEPHNYTQN